MDNFGVWIVVLLVAIVACIGTWIAVDVSWSRDCEKLHMTRLMGKVYDCTVRQ